MKKRSLVLFACLLLCAIKVKSQWQTTGNILFGGEKLGSLNNQPLDFYTNNIARMRLLSTNGFLGIGVGAPQSILHIHDGGLSYLHVTNVTASGNSSSRISN
jgi:hypothetical protein